MSGGGFSATPETGSVTLTWDANAEPDIAGYKVYWGTSSGVYDHFKANKRVPIPVETVYDRPDPSGLSHDRAQARVLHADAAGTVRFRSVAPTAYPVPTDGPVGRMLLASGRHPWRQLPGRRRPYRRARPCNFVRP